PARQRPRRGRGAHQARRGGVPGGGRGVAAGPLMLERLFELRARGSSVGTEFRGAATTFLSMAYILVANPAILAAAGVPFAPAVACTALAAGLCSLAMGLYGNFPIALASGMGLNAVLAYQAAPAAGSWQGAMGLVVIEGAIVLVLVLAGVREKVLE